MTGRLYLHSATSLQAKSLWILPPFARLAGRATEAMRRAPGLVAHEKRTSLLTLEFRTYSIFEDEESLDAFVYSSAHAAAMRRTADFAGPKTVTTRWTSPSDRIDWDEALRRLAAAPPLSARRR